MPDPTPQPVEAAPTPQPETTPAAQPEGEPHKPGEPLYLSAPGEFKPFPGVLAGRPKEVSGQPCTYSLKGLIHPGNYTNHARGFTLSASTDRIKKWCSTGKAMLAAGINVPIVCDHSERARDSLGRIVDFEIRDGELFGLCQFIGADAPLIAARNEVSIGYVEDFTDSQNHRWGDAITHVALTPVPVIPGQSEFLKAASRLYPDAPPEIVVSPPAKAAGERTPPMASEYTLTCSQADYDLMHEDVAGLHEKGLPDKCGHVAAQFRALRQGFTSLLKKLSLVGDEKIEPSAVTGLMSRAGEKIDGLLSRPLPGPAPAPLHPMTLQYVGKSLSGVKERMIEAGWTPASIDSFMGRALQHPRELQTLTLSRTVQEGDEVFVKEAASLIDFFECVLKNPPVKMALGENNTRTLSRVTPGEGEGEQGDPNKPLTPEQYAKIMGHSPLGRSILASTAK